MKEGLRGLKNLQLFVTSFMDVPLGKGLLSTGIKNIKTSLREEKKLTKKKIKKWTKLKKTYQPWHSKQKSNIWAITNNFCHIVGQAVRVGDAGLWTELSTIRVPSRPNSIVDLVLIQIPITRLYRWSQFRYNFFWSI